MIICRAPDNSSGAYATACSACWLSDKRPPAIFSPVGWLFGWLVVVVAAAALPTSQQTHNQRLTIRMAPRRQAYINAVIPFAHRASMSAFAAISGAIATGFATCISGVTPLFCLALGSAFAPNSKPTNVGSCFAAACRGVWPLGHAACTSALAFKRQVTDSTPADFAFSALVPYDGCKLVVGM